MSSTREHISHARRTILNSPRLYIGELPLLDLIDAFSLVVEAVDLARTLPDHEGRRRRNRRQYPLETIAIDRQLALDDRCAAVYHRSEKRGDRSDEALDLAFAETVAEVPHPLRVRLHP